MLISNSLLVVIETLIFVELLETCTAQQLPLPKLALELLELRKEQIQGILNTISLIFDEEAHVLRNTDTNEPLGHEDLVSTCAQLADLIAERNLESDEKGGHDIKNITIEVTKRSVGMYKELMTTWNPENNLLPDNEKWDRLSQVRIFFSPLNCNQDFMIPYEINWEANPAGNVFSVPDIVKLRQRPKHVEYLCENNEVPNYGGVLAYFFIDAFFVPPHELVHFLQGCTKQVDNISHHVSWSAEHDASRVSLMICMLVIGQMIRNGELPDHFLHLVVCNAIRGYLTMRKYLQSYVCPTNDHSGEQHDSPLTAYSVYMDWVHAFGMNLPAADWKSTRVKPFGELCVKHMISVDGIISYFSDYQVLFNDILKSESKELMRKTYELLCIIFENRQDMEVHCEEGRKALSESMAKYQLPFVSTTTIEAWLS